MDENDNKPVTRKLGDYEVIRRISDGSQAAVYEARSLRDGETVAVKVFKEACFDDSADARFRREADLLRNMSHRNIVRYRDSFVARGDWDERQNCLVMEYMKGETLKERLQAHPRGLPWAEARDIMEQTLAGLIYAREQHGVVHRDIKPSNIFVLSDGHVRLFDFGIAKVGGDGTKTGGGSCMGSFDYMAPDFATADVEARSGDDGPFRGDEISDVFSLTMVFYEMLSGQLPWGRFGERPELEYLARWRTGQPKPPSHSPIAFRVIRHLTGLVDKGLNHDRKARFQTFAEMMAAFRELRPRVLKHKGRDEYELLEGLDKGGFGEVYKARRLRDDRIVAIKRLFTDRAPRRFVKEADILRKYAHSNLVEYIDFFESVSSTGNKQLFLVMEYLDGMPHWSLRHRIFDAGAGLDVGEALLLFRYYLDALQYLHENVNPIIHRDIKPGNLYAPAGNPAKAKILDLGVARDVSGTETHGAAPGTWDYMAPEFVSENSRGTPQTDIYALGLSLYEALAGKPAIPRSAKNSDDAAADFVARATGIEKVTVDYSHEVFRMHPLVEQIVRKSIHRDPRERFQSATQMRRAIMHALKEMGKIGALQVDEYSEFDVSHDTAPTCAATQATFFEKETEAVHEWQTWVAEERSKRNTRRWVAAACACMTLGMIGWIVVGQLRRPAAAARTEEACPTPAAGLSTTDGVPAVPPESVAGPGGPAAAQPGAVSVPVESAASNGTQSAPPVDTQGMGPETPVVTAPPPPAGPAVVSAETAPKPVAQPESPAGSVATAPAQADVAPQAAEAATAATAVAPQAEQPVRPEQVPNVVNKQAEILKELLKDLRMLRIRNIVASSYEAFLDDATARLENSRLSLSQPEYDDVRGDPEVSREQERLWLHIGENAIGSYRSTRDGRFLAAARGALLGAATMQGGAHDELVSPEAIKRWSELSKQVDFSKYLPVPLTETLTVTREDGGRPAHSPYTDTLLKTEEFSQSSSAMMPRALSVVLRPQTPGAEARACAVDLLLVPAARTEKITIKDPFYIAKVETTLGMMRAYRDGARAEVGRDPEMLKYFSGKLENQSIQQNDYPCRLASSGEAFEFCNWLSHSCGLQPVYRRDADGKNWTANFEADGFRLPTDQEWEYTARFGIDWYPAPGSVPWQRMREELDRDHSDSVVWFYYKDGPRSSVADGRFRYPTGVFDLCGNMGELAMRSAKWQSMERDRPGMVVCGGNFKNRTADKVMPWSKVDFDAAENVGFRVVLPVRTEILLK
ncbi:MAG: protein kinase [bacterium]